MTRDDAGEWPGILGFYVALMLLFVAVALTCLPRDIAIVLGSWFTLSISAGITLGHCVLNEP